MRTALTEQVDGCEAENTRRTQDEKIEQFHNTRQLMQEVLEDDVRMVSSEGRQSLSCIKSSFHDSSSK